MNINFLISLEKQSKPFWVFTGFALIGAVGIIDYLTGFEFSLSLFYVIPIYLIAWFTTRRLGIVAALVSAFVRLGADIAGGRAYSHPFIPVWNTAIRIALFMIIASLVSSLRKSTEHERQLARTDYLTDAANPRFFYELLQNEIERFQRYKHVFTLAYVDFDNFKYVNDQFGHLAGDRALSTVVHCAKKHLRKTDVVARLGGDEFVLLLPETDREAARSAISKLHDSLLEEMQRNNWPITFSIGVLTCNTSPDSADKLMRNADELMYSAKRDGKNAIRYSAYTG